MNRDPMNDECTRDPIFLLQVGRRQWTEIPEGCEFDGESLTVDDIDSIPEWIEPFVDDAGIDHTDGFWQAAESETNDNGWPYVYVEWRTESVFLTRAEAESFGAARSYRWDKWKVYCVPCEGELATILKNYVHWSK